MINEVCEKNLCTACFSCVNICPKGCITMITDDDKSIRPHIDNEKCINCKKCQKHCPVNNTTEMHSPLSTLAAFSSDNNIHSSSTSGGIATLIALDFIKNGSVVYASALDEGLSVNMKRCSTKADVLSLQGSKYVHSHINDSYSKIKKDLESDINVLMIGVPCQIAGLKSFLEKEYDNLYTIDLICHGAPDQNIFKEYTKKELGKKYKDACDVKFRSQIPFATGVHYIINYFDCNKKSIKALPFRASSYFWSFLYGYSFRENCYSCAYAKKERISDLTLGDFWGFDNEEFCKKTDYGINLVLLNTQHGIDMFEKIKNQVEFCESSFEQASKGNDQLKRPAYDTEISKRFRRLCKSKGTIYALKHCDNKTLFLSKIRKLAYRNDFILKALVKFPKIKEKL